MQQVANRNVGIWEIAHATVSRRPLIPLHTIVARIEGFTHDAHVWDFSLGQGPFFVTPVPRPVFRFAAFTPLYGRATPTSREQSSCTPETYRVNVSVYQSGVDSKRPFSNRPLMP
jgi:hypothetical protein